jgi:hypothetical protein
LRDEGGLNAKKSLSRESIELIVSRASSVGISTQSQKFIDNFFEEIEPLHGTNKNLNFSYLAIKQDDYFYLVQGALALNAALSLYRISNRRTSGAGNYRLAELGLDPRGWLLLCFPVKSRPLAGAGNFGATYEPFHQEGIKNQTRLEVLTVIGGRQTWHARQPLYDWEYVHCATLLALKS